MVEIGGKPILWHIMKIYSHYGVREFVLCLGYRGNMIKEYFLNYEAMNNDFTIRLGDQHRDCLPQRATPKQDFSITLVETGPETMTGGRVKRIEKYIDDDCFMVTYGDGVADLDISKLLAFHSSHGRLATITAVRPISRFGTVNVDVEQRAGHQFHGKAADARLDQRRFHGVPARGCSTTLAVTTACWKPSRWSGWPGTGN